MMQNYVVTKNQKYPNLLLL